MTVFPLGWPAPGSSILISWHCSPRWCSLSPGHLTGLRLRLTARPLLAHHLERTLQCPRLSVWLPGSTSAYRAKAWLQTWPCPLLGWMMWQHAGLYKWGVEGQLKWSNSSQFMFLHWFTRRLLYSVFCVKVTQHFCCVNKRGRWNLIWRPTYHFSCNFSYVGDSKPFPFQKFMFYG